MLPESCNETYYQRNSLLDPPLRIANAIIQVIIIIYMAVILCITHIHPKSIVSQLCKHSKDASLDSLYDIKHRVQSSIMALTNVTIYCNALVIMATLLCTILQTFFVLFCIMLERT